MANWCYNFVQFQGTKEGIAMAVAVFKKLELQEREEKEEQLPDFINGLKGYMSSIYSNEDTVSFETRWSPNAAIIMQIADRFKLNFTQSYTELGNLIYGEYAYYNGVLTDVFLDDRDFGSYYINPDDADSFVFEGEVYQNICEILDTMLERKRNQATA